MDDIGKPVKRTDFDDKVEGRARYCADIRPEGMLLAKTFRSDRPRAEILSIEIPPLPDGCLIVDASDIPGVNSVPLVFDDQPFLARRFVNYIGEPILLVVGPDPAAILSVIDGIRVTYRDLKPILSMEEAALSQAGYIFRDQPCFVDYAFEKGNVEEAIHGAVRCIEGTYCTGLQEQAYLEPQSMLACYEDDLLTVYGSMQCPYYIENALCQALGWPSERIRVVQLPTGGGFGGKEEYLSLIGVHAGLAAVKSGKPVRLVLERSEDIAATTKRHPSQIVIKSWLDAENRILAHDVDVSLDGGAYSGLSSVVLQRTIFTVGGVYKVPNLRVRGRAYATNHPVSGAFRGFGGPQALFATEMQMERIARETGLDAMDLKRRHFLCQGDTSTTGGVFHHEIHLEKIVSEMEAMSGYSAKHARYGRALAESGIPEKDANDGTSDCSGHGLASDSERRPDLLRGIGCSVFLHGCGFTGSGEQDMLKARVRLKKERDGTVRVYVSSTEIGQGALTTLRKIVAGTLEIPLERVLQDYPDTASCPDSGPTVASRTTMIVGRLLQLCADKLKTRWSEPEIDLLEEYRYPSHLRWDNDRFEGNAYPEYSWGSNVVEVEVEPDTGVFRVLGAWGVFDIGTPLDRTIVRGQLEGGMVQGLGYGGMEVLQTRNGKPQQASFTDYMIPTSVDFPDIACKVIESFYPDGPFGAKGLGELSLVGAAPALALAVEQAIGMPVTEIPVRPETILKLLQSRKGGKGGAT